ncbi:MAG: ATP-dependent zinc metalloprotease FtsH, partial [Chlamydiae bacterium]|nr:ATP-dependent zinc metalloprotease FtsH [Chlamydiota bacterium]
MSVPGTDVRVAPKRTYNLRSRGKQKRQRIHQNVEKIVANIIAVSEPNLISKNTVWMNNKDVQDLRDTSWDSEAPLYVQIAERVYTVESCSWIAEKNIGLNPQQETEIVDSINDDGTVVVSTFIPTDQNHLQLKRAVFSVSYEDEEDLEYEDRREDLLVDASQFENQFKQTYEGQLFKDGQTILTYHNNYPINMTLVKSRGYHTPSSCESFGAITEETDLIFQSTELTNIKFYSLPEFGDYRFAFDVIMKHGIHGDDLEERILRIFEGRFTPLEDTVSTFPYIVDADKLQAFVRNMLEGTPIIEGDIKKIPLEGGGFLNVRLFEVRDQNEVPSNICSVNSREFEYPKAYQIESYSPLQFFAQSSNLVFTKGEPKVAKYVSFSILEVDEEKSRQGWENSLKNWINTKEFIEKIQSQVKEFVDLTQFEIMHEGVCFRVQVDKVDAHFSTKKRTRISTYSPCWKFGRSTKINLEVSPEIERIFVKNDKTQPLKGIKVNLEPAVRWDDTSKLRLNMADLERAFRAKAPKKLCQDQGFVLELKKIGRFNVTIESLNFNDSDLNNSLHMYLGELTDETNFEFTHVESITVDEKEQPLDLTDPFKTMEKLGLTGLPKGGKELLEDVLYSLDPRAAAVGFKKPRGVLLSGPPGTGKTTFVQNLAKMLGIPKSRLNMISGTTPLSKWVGGSEKNIRKLFEPAIKDPDNLYFLFIDEFDGLAAKRTDDTPYQNKVVNEFLSQMDGVHRPENLMVFATTNHKSLIDPGCFRPGRFERVVEFALPTRKECFQILQLHAKSLVEERLVARNVNFKELANLAEGMSGAHIRGMVSEAKKNYFRRIKKEKFKKSDPRSKICHDDFLKAHKDIQTNRCDRCNVEPLIKGEVLDPRERPRDALKRIGPVGLPKEILDFVDSLVFATRNGREHAEKIGFKIPRGILIHGRPGLGKTMLAKSLVHLMGIPPHRINILTASDFKHKNPDEERAFVREVVLSAKSEDTSDAPIHVIILENLFYISKLVQGQLFKLLEEEKGLDNLLIIAMTNVIDLVEEPEKYHILQEYSLPSRFQKIIEMKPPKDLQRLEIIKFLLKDLVEAEMLHEDVDLNWLVR